MSTNPLTRLKDRAYAEARPMTALCELTYKCNLLCSFCYNAPKKRAEMDTEQWKSTIDKLKAAGSFTVILSGGEPLSHRGFFEIAQHVRDRGLVLKAYTNGVLLADLERAKRYAALAPFDTEISLHGADAATHDRLTGIRDSFDKLMIAFENLSSLGVKVSIKTPITRLNQNQLRAVEELGERFGYPVTYDTNIVPTDDGDTGPLGMAADKRFLVAFFVDQVRRGKRGLNRRPVEKMSHNCGTGLTSIAIDPYGDVFPCVAWRRRIANILELEDLGALWQAPKGANATLDHVREVAREVPLRTLADQPEGGFASFCPAVAEREMGDAYALYPAARVSGLTKLEAFEELRQLEAFEELRQEGGENASGEKSA